MSRLMDLVAGDATGRLHIYHDSGGGPESHSYRLPITLEAGGAPFHLDPGPGPDRSGVREALAAVGRQGDPPQGHLVAGEAAR